jgi:catechol 2,3-dioxygenase-like lactoylglutathione lyase family enzyme
VITANPSVRAERATATRFHAPQVILFSRNVDRAAAFYSSLGFEELYRRPVAGEPTHVDLALEGYVIGIASAADDVVREGRQAALTLWTDDVHGAFAELTANGAPALVAPREWPGGLVIAWVADPDGNAIQIAQSL